MKKLITILAIALPTASNFPASPAAADGRVAAHQGLVRAISGHQRIITRHANDPAHQALGRYCAMLAKGGSEVTALRKGSVDALMIHFHPEDVVREGRKSTGPLSRSEELHRVELGKVGNLMLKLYGHDPQFKGTLLEQPRRGWQGVVSYFFGTEFLNTATQGTVQAIFPGAKDPGFLHVVAETAHTVVGIPRSQERDGDTYHLKAETIFVGEGKILHTHGDFIMVPGMGGIPGLLTFSQHLNYFHESPIESQTQLLELTRAAQQGIVVAPVSPRNLTSEG